MDTENATMSHIPKPSSYLPRLQRPASPEKTLNEITSSDNNARSALPMPPPGLGRKHGLSSTYEPPAKRTTLRERAGQPIKEAAAAPPTHRKVNGIAKPAVGSGAGTYRNASMSSSVSSASHPSSRNTSNSSFSNSVGPGYRPQSKQSLAQPNNTYTHSRAKTGPSRPATALGTRITAQEGPTPKGMSIFVRSHSSRPRKRPSFLHETLPPQNGPGPIPNARRVLSLSRSLQSLSLESESRAQTALKSPSKLPRTATPRPEAPDFTVSLCSLSQVRTPQKGGRKSPIKSVKSPFLTKSSNLKGWTTEEQAETMERLWNDWHAKISQTVNETTDMKESLNIYKSTSEFRFLARDALRSLTPYQVDDGVLNELTRVLVLLVAALEKAREDLTENSNNMRVELQLANKRVDEVEDLRRRAQQDHEIEMDDLEQRQRIQIETVRQESKLGLEEAKADHREELREVKRRLEGELDQERAERLRALSQLSTQGALDKQRQQLEMEARVQDVRIAREEIERVVAEVERERALNLELRQNVTAASSNAATMESSRQALQAKIGYLESDSKSQSEAYAGMERQMREAIEEAQRLQDKLRREETVRRKLHNQVQELKGNIRVFCRVRPNLSTDPADEEAKITFPDDAEEGKEIEVRGPEEKSSLGTVTTKKYPFAFDRVFGPSSQNDQVFDEVSQLIQSALDGYNVCIFCYGQTGSGKTHTMSSSDGMIPQAVHMIYATAQDLQERGWSYTMTGSFVEVYNENLNDLLGRPDDLDKKKLEIRHDTATSTTTITDITTVSLDSPATVETMLTRASANRSVAATKANERSSRSHSVFILSIHGTNRITGETSRGTLNLVDLAGSERLSQSRVEGARLKETQNINRSLSCLGDVIGALGQGKEGSAATGHIPYRNSKLTYLLQFSLGGNSKTLMFCMVSPLAGHLSETLTSLRFATKVHNTHIGHAKKQAKS